MSALHDRLSDSELADLFRRLFPTGFWGNDVLGELAPDGWENSPLLRAFHPTPEQWHEERVSQHRHFKEIDRLFRKKGGKRAPAAPQSPEPTLEDSRREFIDKPVDAREESTEILGAVVWEVFSDNHAVVTADGHEVDLGSWRAASAFLSEFANGGCAEERWERGDCMRFYMGLLWIRERCDYGPVYRLVFRRLRGESLDWRYTFPRLHVFRFDSEATETPALHDYSPSKAFAREQERQTDEAEFARMQADLEEHDRTAREQACTAPPPAIVQAYRNVFGRWPEGWPPSALP